VCLEILINKLKKKNLTVAVAESCSGGYLSYLLTKVAGSSLIFKGAIVAYSLEAKNKFFKIPYSLLKKTQGVSQNIALFLASEVKKIFKSDFGLSLVGFAGPKARKGIKVGTVFLGLVNDKEKIVKKIIIKGERDTVRKKASMELIKLLYQKLK
jgi:PncC family amidohydrolase